MNAKILCPGESIERKLEVAAKDVFEVLRQQAPTDPLVIALCGGRSVVGLLKALLDESEIQPPELLKRVQFFMVDERIVPPSHPESNFGGLKGQFFDALIKRGRIAADQLHVFSIVKERAYDDCAAYLSELERFGGAFTVVVLGMGEDGHIAGLFPNHGALRVQESSFVPFFDSPKPPADRVTASRHLITSASLGVLLALGESKRDAWNAFLSRDISVEQCPAKLAESIARCVVITDLDA